MANFRALYDEIEQLENVDGISATTLLDLPEEIAPILRKIARQKAMDLNQFAVELQLSREDAVMIGDLLTQKGYLYAEQLDEEQGKVYCIYFARMRKRNLPFDL